MKSTNLVFWHEPIGFVPLVIDVVADDNGVQRGRISGETLDQIAARYPGVKVSTIDEYTAQHDEAYRTDPMLIDEEQYRSALECMPPLNWRRTGGVESFMCVERLSGSITRIYACVGNTYWTFKDRDDLTAAEIADKILAEVAQS